MSTDNLPAERPPEAHLSAVEAVLRRLDTIEELTRQAMKPDIDYGTIPGTQKPTLLMPGAEKLCVLFRLSPSFKTTKTFTPDSHLLVESTCCISDSDGLFLGEASAICSTRESKYAFRRAARQCPQCGKPAIIKGKDEYGGGWICFKKKGGCGKKFRDGDPSIEGQAEGQIPNENLADSYNTVLRIAEKRAYVAAVRKVTGSSGFFDEEIPGEATEREPEHAPAPPALVPPPHVNTLPPASAPPPELDDDRQARCISKEQWTELARICRLAGIQELDFLADYNITRPRDFPLRRYDEAKLTLLRVVQDKAAKPPADDCPF